MDIRNVVVPLDGSALSEQALPLASLIARRADACLRIVAVVPGAAFLDLEDLPAFVGEGIRRAGTELQEYVDDIVAEVRKDAYVRATGIVRVDRPADGVLRTVEDTSADLIVMTSHGRGGFKRFWLGSVTDAVLRRAHVPVLVVKMREQIEPDLTIEPAFDEITVPLDGTPMGETAIEPALRLARALGLRMKLVRVVTPIGHTLVPPYPAPLAPPLDDGTAQQYLDRVVHRLTKKERVEATGTVVHDDAIAPAIVGFAAGSITVLATNATDGLGRLLIGSIPDKVVRLSDYPVMVVRALQPGSEEKDEAILALASADAP